MHDLEPLANFPEPPCAHLQDGDNDATYLTDLVRLVLDSLYKMLETVAHHRNSTHEDNAEAATAEMAGDPHQCRTPTETLGCVLWWKQL